MMSAIVTTPSPFTSNNAFILSSESKPLIKFTISTISTAFTVPSPLVSPSFFETSADDVR